jgi:hypothetical protein
MIIATLRVGSFTAEEISEVIGLPGKSVQPRVSELYRDEGVIEPTGERRPTAMGCMATVWRLKPNLT